MTRNLTSAGTRRARVGTAAKRHAHLATVTQPYQGTSIGPMGARLAEMFGGEGDTKGTGSWINHPRPDATTKHASSDQAVADVLFNVYQYATGTFPVQTGDPSWYPVVAWPSISINQWSAAINVADHTKTPLKPVTVVGAHATDSWHMATSAMLRAGWYLPDGYQPTNDSDATASFYFPDWKWIGDPTDQNYWGLYQELWGARSPEQNAALGLPAVWTCSSGGRMVGVNNRLTAHMTQRTATTGDTVKMRTDAANQSVASFGAAKTPLDTFQSSPSTYWGYGPDGVVEESWWLASASHLPMSHHVVTMRDIQNGKIRHPIGFLLFPMEPQSAGSQGMVWPATGYDGASRSYLKHGNIIRYVPGLTASSLYPSGMPTSWRPLFDIFFNAMRDNGIILIDTQSSTFNFRAEPGIQQFFPSGFDVHQFMLYLFQPAQADPTRMRMEAVGSDTNFWP